jgi:hypothetical protein
MSVNFYQTTRRYNPEDRHLRTHRRDNLKTWKIYYNWTRGSSRKRFLLFFKGGPELLSQYCGQATYWTTAVRIAASQDFFLHRNVHTGSGVHPPPVHLYQDCFVGGKAARTWNKLSPLSIAEVKNAWSYTSTPPYVYMAWCLVKRHEQFRLYCYVYSLQMSL